MSTIIVITKPPKPPKPPKPKPTPPAPPPPKPIPNANDAGVDAGVDADTVVVNGRKVEFRDGRPDFPELCAVVLALFRAWLS